MAELKLTKFGFNETPNQRFGMYCKMITTETEPIVTNIKIISEYRIQKIQLVGVNDNIQFVTFATEFINNYTNYDKNNVIYFELLNDKNILTKIFKFSSGLQSFIFDNINNLNSNHLGNNNINKTNSLYERILLNNNDYEQTNLFMKNYLDFYEKHTMKYNNFLSTKVENKTWIGYLKSYIW